MSQTHTMLTIIQQEAMENGMHGLQAQSGRTESWLEGWLAVPPELEEQVWASGGWCDLIVEDGVLTGIVPGERPALPEEIAADPQRDTDALLVDHEYRIALLELERKGGTEHAV